MVGYPGKVGEREVSAAGTDLPISTKKSAIVCKKINKMELGKAKSFLKKLLEKEKDINGKHYTKTAKEILRVLENGENNAKYRGLENPVIRTISAEQGPKRLRRKRKRSFGSELKNTHIKLVLREGKKK